MKATVSKYVHYLAIGVVALLGVAAFCPPPASAEEGQGIGAILPHMDEFIPMLVAFIILWIILAKFGWPLFDGMLKKREDTIKNSPEEARQESERLLAEYREQLEGAKAQAQQMLNNARQSCDAMESEAKQKAQEEAAAIVAKAKVAICAEKHRRSLNWRVRRRPSVDIAKKRSAKISATKSIASSSSATKEAGSLNA